ncbi:hypothetical protein E0J20_09130 [Rhizobium leguminosarum bv. viciae]|nr:hypothetical protein E0J20_09130 [Rhizobium leguminosarum bv. viciae]
MSSKLDAVAGSAIIIGAGLIVAGFPVIGLLICGPMSVIAFVKSARLGMRGGSLSVAGFLVMLVFAGPLVMAGVGFFIKEEPNADQLANQRKYAASLCPDYFTWNLVQQWNSTRSWCRNYPQFDGSHAAQAAKIDNEATGSTTVSSNTLWK